MKHSFLIIVLFLSACASSPTVSCYQAIAGANQSLTVAYESTGTLLKDDIIAPDLAENVLKNLDTASGLVDKAKPVCAYGDRIAFDYVRRALDILEETQASIRENRK